MVLTIVHIYQILVSYICIKFWSQNVKHLYRNSRTVFIQELTNCIYTGTHELHKMLNIYTGTHELYGSHFHKYISNYGLVFMYRNLVTKWKKKQGLTNYMVITIAPIILGGCYIFVFTHKHTHMYICVCVYVGVCEYMCICICICMYVRMYAYVYYYRPSAARGYLYTPVYRYVCICMYMYMHMYMHGYIPTHVHTHSHTHMNMCISTCICIYVCMYAYV